MENKGFNERDFMDPAAEYRPSPFWGLNDELKDEVLRSQIQEMKDKGWGGFFTHARYGLETPYLSDEYMERMKTCVDEAQKQGLEAWIYDEHPFPAGCAGGLSTACNREYRHKTLVMRMHNRLTPIDPKEALGYFAVKLDANDVPVAVRRIEDPWNDHGPEHHFMHFYLWTESLNQTHQPGFSNYDDNIIHGFASSDNLNPDAVRKFIEETYGRFHKNVGDQFGTVVKGGFSDIPVSNWNYASPHPSVPWTTGFEKIFLRECGYDLLNELPSLFYDLGDYRKVRCDYWRVSNKVFVESFTRQLYDWHEANGLKYTAHYWGEETLHWQIPWVGDAMAHFAYHHYVGMDHSIRNIEDPLGIKQASSVAEQLSKPRMVSEMYGMNGNSLTHEERKWQADWAYALGTNFLVPYVALYSYRGRRKRDEPSSLFTQQAYWKYEKTFYDYYGRLSYALTRGKRVVSVLLMQPLTTAFAMYRPSIDYPQAHRPDPLSYEGSTEELFTYNRKWMDLCDTLLGLHRDFHLGNEAVMADHGGVKDGQMMVGEYAYPVVIVPSSTTWNRDTVERFRQFAKQGGRLIAIRPLPEYIQGEKAQEVLPAETLVIDDDPGALKRALDECLEKDVILRDTKDILYQHRKNGDEDIYFFANTSLTDSYPGLEIAVRHRGVLELWDARTGRKHRLPCMERDGKSVFVLDFAPVASYLVVSRQEEAAPLTDYVPLPTKTQTVCPLSDTWKIVDMDDPNALVLDYCAVQVGSQPWTEVMPVWKAQRVVKQAGIGAKYRIRYSFEMKQSVSRLELLLEFPDQLKAWINGQRFPTQSGGKTWFDPSFYLFDIAHGCQAGTNEIVYEGILGIGSDIENCILLGDFALNREKGFAIQQASKTVRAADLTKGGYPFYTGCMKLGQSFTVGQEYGPVFISFDKVEATLARVFVNQQHVGDLPWKPYTLNITSAIHPGENEVTVELVTTRNNLFGPHHDKRGEVRTFCAPHIWTNELMWTDEYYFTPLGLVGGRIERG